MGLRFPAQQYCTCFFVTTTFVNWQPFGNHPGMYQALADSLIFYCEKYEGSIAGYAFMPSHLHLLLFIDGKVLGPFMRDFKKYVTQKAAPELGIHTSRLWMPRYDRVAVESEDLLRTKLNYIHLNPVKAGGVLLAEHWKWSSAGAYMIEQQGPIPVWKGWA